MSKISVMYPSLRLQAEFLSRGLCPHLHPSASALLSKCPGNGSSLAAVHQGGTPMSWTRLRGFHGRRGSGRGTPRKSDLSGEGTALFQDGLETEVQSHQIPNAVDQDAHLEEMDSGYHSDTETNGLHEPVMLDKVMSFFAPAENQVFLDMTFGGGGHTQALLKSAPGVKVYALDRDPLAHQIAEKLSQYHRGHLFPMLGRFSEVRELLSQRGLGECSLDGVLIDAGCSSYQFDSPHRGFSLSQDGPLDMRMDGDRFPTQPTAADVINSVDLPTLANILRTYGEEPNARKIAQAVVDYRTTFRPFSSTQELATVVACCFTHRQSQGNRDKLGRRSHTATRTFQALRIFVNNELNELAVGLAAARDALRPRGKLAVLSFHSLEDRVAKRSIQGRDVAEKGASLRKKRLAPAEGEDGEEEDDGVGATGWKMERKKVVLPDEAEIAANPRARSAKLRTAIKL